MKTKPLLALTLIPALLASCKNSESSGYEDPYVDFGSDGTYNPYPDSGYASTAPRYEAPPSDPYSFNAPAAPAPKPAAPKPAASKPSTTASRPAAKPAAKKPATTASRSHTVVKGDTLYGLARRYNTSVAKIKSANGLSSDLIRIGQRLRIP
jgi:nucleoid-associated protein YgaU